MKKDFGELRAFAFDKADVFLWVFKTQAGGKFKAWYVATDAGLNEELKGFAKGEMARITECEAYAHLAQTNEHSALVVAIADTNAEALRLAVRRPEQEHRAMDRKPLVNASGYVVKFVLGKSVVMATRRATQSWKTAYRKKGLLAVSFNDAELSAVPDEQFIIDPHFDMYCINDHAFISNKRGFESLMQYKTGYQTAFAELLKDEGFASLFTDTQPLTDAVGTNSMHLRRMATIDDKKLYALPGFLKAVRKISVKRNWGIKFNKAGRIVPDVDTVQTIMKVLLDQRLLSEITELLYDVPHGEVVK
jgi:hypothetical protein